MNWGRWRTEARYAAVFVAGLLLGGLAVDVLAAGSMRAQVLNVHYRLHSEQSLRARKARCEGDWLHVALHSWAANSSQPIAEWKTLEVQPMDGSLLAPLLGWILLDVHDDVLAVTEGPVAVGYGIDYAEYARALEQLARPEAAEAWAEASARSGLPVERLRRLVPHASCSAQELDLLERALTAVTTGEASAN